MKSLLFKKISLSSDHAGFNLKEIIKKKLIRKKIKVIDLGPKKNNSVEGFMTDVKAVADMHISITPLHLDLTHVGSLKSLKKTIKQ